MARSRDDVTELEAALHLLAEGKRAEMRARWNRDLPLEELLGDRWDRARSLGFGEGSSIYAVSYVYGDVVVGKNVWIGPYTLLDGTGGLSIGDHCCISAGVQIYSHNTVAATVSAGRAPAVRRPVSIGARTYIGSQSIVADGVSIGEGCVIGAASFVNRDIPAGSLAFGTPCRVMGRVDLAEDGSVAVVRSAIEDPA